MAISVYQDSIFLLQTRRTSYVLSVHPATGLLCNVYWGTRIDRIQDFAGPDELRFHRSLQVQQLMEECSSFGGMRFKEASMKLTFADGVRDFRYKVKEFAADGDHLAIVLEDIHYPVQVTLHYRVYEEENIIAKWREIENAGGERIVIERFYSAEYGVAGTGWRTMNYNGHWGSEFRLHSEPIDSGKKVYESLHGLTAHTANPFFAVHEGGADEDDGDVYFGALQYSGNFKSVVEAVSCDYVNVLIGISDTDFEWLLEPGETFAAPAVFAGYTARGFADMSHTLAEFARRHVMPRPLADKPLPVLYNSWYATLFDVRSEEQIRLAEKAARLGVELFVIDDGWFAGRTSDKAGLGDWYVDRAKFPDGLEPLIRRVNELGMAFGIWIEPEMVNPDSELYRRHPDWIYRYETREVLTGRNQYMLDMTNPAVVDYLIDSFDRLLADHNIAFVKWDMNRYAAEAASAFRKPEEFKSIWHRNTIGVYAVIRALRERHPQVEFEACASGGGRVDFGAMAYFDEFWPSDNTDPLDRLSIQENYSYIYPIKYMRAWLTDDRGMNDRSVPLRFGMHAAMCGALGIGTDLNAADDAQLDEMKRYIDEYKRIRDVVQLGRLYRLQSLRTGDIQAVQYAADDASALFVFLDHERYGKPYHRVRLKGLDEAAVYAYELNGERRTSSGAYLMNRGVDVRLTGDYASALIRFERA